MFQSQSFLKEYNKPDVMLQLRWAKVRDVTAFFPFLCTWVETIRYIFKHMESNMSSLDDAPPPCATKDSIIENQIHASMMLLLTSHSTGAS